MVSVSEARPIDFIDTQFEAGIIRARSLNRSSNMNWHRLAGDMA